MKIIANLDGWPSRLTFIPENDDDRAFNALLRDRFHPEYIEVQFEEYDDKQEHGEGVLSIEEVCNYT
jgi:hypothetical protein